jgi:hypothetical protein
MRWLLQGYHMELAMYVDAVILEYQSISRTVLHLIDILAMAMVVYSCSANGSTIQNQFCPMSGFTLFQCLVGHFFPPTGQIGIQYPGLCGMQLQEELQ